MEMEGWRDGGTGGGPLNSGENSPFKVRILVILLVITRGTCEDVIEALSRLSIAGPNSPLL